MIKKFRCWDKIKNRMFDVTGLRFEGIGGGIRTVSAMECQRPVEEFEVMQFTGLHDKNGKEIYEGDILKIGKDLIEEVKWIEVGNWMGEKQPMVGFISHGTIYKNSPIEVIGNIYENPELLSKE